MEVAQSPRLKVVPRPGSCGTSILPALSVHKSAAKRTLSKRRLLCSTSVHPPVIPKSPSRTQLTIGTSNCSTRSSSRGSTGRLQKSSTLSFFDGNLSLMPPAVSAQAWAVTDGCSGAFLYGSHEHDPHPIASLTKILTVYTCLRLAKTLPGVSLDLHCKVSARAAAMTGTRAGLWAGDDITVRNLLYGVMLPSGNDAAVCLAEGLGAVLSAERGLDISENHPEKVYMKQMNAYAEELGLTHSVFRNPSGLDLNGNTSTAHDVNLVATAAMRLGCFRTIVRSQEHCFSLKGGSGFKRDIRWVNTNKLLNLGYDGLKTGVTPASGPCLTASLHCPAGHIIVTVLHCKSLEDRWSEVVSLVTWAQTILQCR